MDKKKAAEGFDLGSLIISVMTGLVIYIVLVALASALSLNGMLEEAVWKWYAKTAFILAIFIQCLYLRKKGRGSMAVPCMIGGFMCCFFAALLSYINSDSIELLRLMVYIILGLGFSFLMSIPKVKNSKLHKRRK